MLYHLPAYHHPHSPWGTFFSPTSNRRQGNTTPSLSSPTCISLPPDPTLLTAGTGIRPPPLSILDASYFCLRSLATLLSGTLRTKIISLLCTEEVRDSKSGVLRPMHLKRKGKLSARGGELPDQAEPGVQSLIWPPKQTSKKRVERFWDCSKFTKLALISFIKL